MALTLVEAAKLAANQGQTVRANIIELFARSSDLLMAMPFTDIPGNAHRYNLEQALPGIAFRGVNEGYTPSTGIINPQVEQLVIAGGDLDVDRYIVRTMGEQVRAQHEAMKVKALARTIDLKFIKGDTATSAKEFDGLQKRLTGSQLIEAGSTNGGDALSLAKLDEAIDAVDSPTHLYMNRAMRRRLTAAARTPAVSGYITYGVDAFGRQVTLYNDLPILIADKLGAEEVLGFNEVGVGGSAATATSIYVLSLRAGELGMIQNGGMQVDDLGELQSQPQYRTRVEWYVSPILEFPRAAARLRGISNAAIVA